MNEKEIKFGLISIKVTSFDCASDDILMSDVDVTSLQYRYGTVTKIIPERDSVVIKSTLKYHTGTLDYFNLDVTLDFFVDNLPAVVSYNKEARELAFNPDIIPIFLNITCGTVRGILAEKMKDNSFAAFPLPLLTTPVLQQNNRLEIN